MIAVVMPTVFVDFKEIFDFERKAINTLIENNLLIPRVIFDALEMK